MKESAKILTIIMVVFFGFATIVGGGVDKDEPVQVISSGNGVPRRRLPQSGSPLGRANRGDASVMDQRARYL